MSTDEINVTIEDAQPIYITLDGYGFLPTGITIRESDGTPTIDNVTVLELDQDAGLSVENLGNGIAKVSAAGEVVANQMIIEEPIQLTVRRFQTTEAFEFSHLKVFLNGIKEKFIVQISDTEFEFEIDIVDTDDIEVEYIKKS